jgi:hypothetical protein
MRWQYELALAVRASMRWPYEQQARLAEMTHTVTVRAVVPAVVASVVELLGIDAPRKNLRCLDPGQKHRDPKLCLAILAACLHLRPDIAVAAAGWHASEHLRNGTSHLSLLAHALALSPAFFFDRARAAQSRQGHCRHCIPASAGR